MDSHTRHDPTRKIRAAHGTVLEARSWLTEAPLRMLRGLAQQRHAPLVLMPAVGDLAETKLQEALEVSQISLQAIHGQLARPIR